MAEYQVEIERSAVKELEQLNLEVLGRASQFIEQLADDPRPRGCAKLGGSKNTYRLRVGDYRMLYQVGDKSAW